MRGHARSSLVPGLCLLLTACATVGPPQPPSLELPKPASDLRAARKGNKVVLTWTAPSQTTDRQTMRSFGVTRICRGTDLALSQCGPPVGEAPPTKPANGAKSSGKLAAGYTDVLPPALATQDPAAQITYAVEVLNASGRSAGLSNRAQVYAAATLPPPATQAAVAKEGVIVSWSSGTAPGDSLPHKLRVYRRQDGASRASQVGETHAQTGTPPPGTFTDQSFEWEKTYYYHTVFVTVIAGQGKPDAEVEGDDSPEIKVFADDVFPPAVPSGLQAVFSGPGQAPFIDLIWAPVTDVDLDGYYVYRHEEGTAPVRLNAELLKAPAYRDTGVVPGKTYVYSVSSVDVRGNESAPGEAAGESVP